MRGQGLQFSFAYDARIAPIKRPARGRGLGAPYKGEVGGASEAKQVQLFVGRRVNKKLLGSAESKLRK